MFRRLVIECRRALSEKAALSYHGASEKPQTAASVPGSVAVVDRKTRKIGMVAPEKHGDEYDIIHKKKKSKDD